jgi:hypothetical protein
LELDGFSNEPRKKIGQRLIKKIYKIDSLTCPKYSGKMKVVKPGRGLKCHKIDPQTPWFIGNYP